MKSYLNPFKTKLTRVNVHQIRDATSFHTFLSGLKGSCKITQKVEPRPNMRYPKHYSQDADVEKILLPKLPYFYLYFYAAITLNENPWSSN